jgi:hypothetical protein
MNEWMNGLKAVRKKKITPVEKCKKVVDMWHRTSHKKIKKKKSITPTTYKSK